MLRFYIADISIDKWIFLSIINLAMKHKQKNDPNRTAADIVREIKGLLDQLVSITPSSGHTVSRRIATSAHDVVSRKGYSGPLGGIRLLLEEGFFKERKTVAEVAKRLHQEGFNYRRQVVSVTLLRLVRNRTLVRLESENPVGKEKWVYAERK